MVVELISWKDLDLDLLELGGAVQWQEPNTARVQVFFFGGGKGKCERIPEFGVEITSMVVSGSRKRW